MCMHFQQPADFFVLFCISKVEFYEGYIQLYTVLQAPSGHQLKMVKFSIKTTFQWKLFEGLGGFRLVWFGFGFSSVGVCYP